MGSTAPCGSKGAPPEVTFNHLDPDGKLNPYTPEQSMALARSILSAPLGGKFKLPGLEDRFEIIWGSEAKGWKPASSGMYQRNVVSGNKRAVEVTEIDAWLEVYEKVLSEDKTAKKPCRHWDKCYNRSPDHRLRFLHPDEGSTATAGDAGKYKVQLVASEIGGIAMATAYHTSILVDGEEFSFSPDGVYRARGPASHHEAPKPPQITDMGTSAESGTHLFAALKNYFRPGTYDLLQKNCNSFSDVALYFLVQQRLSFRYKVLERCGRSLPSLVEKVSGGGYMPNEKAAGFDTDTVIQELDRILASTPAICITPGCGKPSWNGFPGERCSRTCGRKESLK